MASLPVSPWITSASVMRGGTTVTTTASLPLHAAAVSTRPTSLSLSLNRFSTSPLLHCSFLSPFPSSLSGLSLGFDLASSVGARREKGRGLVVRAGKAALCLTKRNRSRKSLARTHGFRRRMRTTSGRAVLKRRRAKGRKVLCTKSHPNSGK